VAASTSRQGSWPGPPSAADPAAAHRSDPSLRGRVAVPPGNHRGPRHPDPLSDNRCSTPLGGEQHNPACPLSQARPDGRGPPPRHQQLTITRSQAQRLRAHSSFSRRNSVKRRSTHHDQPPADDKSAERNRTKGRSCGAVDETAGAGPTDARWLATDSRALPAAPRFRRLPDRPVSPCGPRCHVQPRSRPGYWRSLSRE
jgi:hypothetical protein